MTPPVPSLPLANAVGRPPGQLREEIGPPDRERRVGDDLWLVFERAGGTLRVRCRGPADPGAGGDGENRPDDGPGGAVVTSWTLSLSAGATSLREATEPLGLWPACAPDAEAGDVTAPLVRRALEGPDGARRTLTATVRGGRITGITVFDEAPDWL